MDKSVHKIDVVIPAAGTGSRVGAGVNKLLLNIGGTTVIERTVERFLSRGDIGRVILACSEVDRETYYSLFGDRAIYVLGGATRRDSVMNALPLVTTDYVLVHDGARPYVSDEVIDRVVRSLGEYHAVIPVLPITDTVKMVDGDLVEGTIDRDRLRVVQTPQGFCTADLIRAYDVAPTDITDDASAYECIGYVHTVEGDIENIKLTYREDFSPRAVPTLPRLYGYRVGLGIDAHRLVEGRPLILGGVEIPYEYGLLGHSDADVLLHAVMDAILSASHNRDIGYHFPDTDERYRGADSSELLRVVLDMTRELGYKVSTLSIVVVCQRPKLRDYIPEISRSIADIVGVHESMVSVSATTTERMGYAGEGVGIACECVATLSQL